MTARRALLIGLEDLPGRALAAARAGGWSVVRAAGAAEVEDVPADVIVVGETALGEVAVRRSHGRHEPALAIVPVELAPRARAAGCVEAVEPGASGVVLAAALAQLTGDDTPPVVALGAATLDLQRGIVVAGDRVLPLAPTELGLLRALARRLGAPVPRDRLLAEVWGYGPRAVTRAVDHAVRRLRERLSGVDPGAAGALETVRGAGYRLRGAAVTRPAAAPRRRARLPLGRRTLDLVAGAVEEPDGQTTPLSRRERVWVTLLSEADGALVDRATLAAAGGLAADNTLDRALARLRARLEDDPRRPIHLRTVRGVGVRLVPGAARAAPPALLGFVGRAAERARLASAGPGLWTVVGLPGVGKSALLRVVARDVALAGGSVQPVDRPELASAPAGREPPWVLVDPTEGDPDAAAVAALVASAPGARVIVASRAPLGVAGERVIALGPLRPSEAAELLIGRVRAVRAELGVDPEPDADTLAAVEGIAARVDHVPLLLELAARPLATGDRAAAARGLGPDLVATLARCVAQLGDADRDVLAAVTAFAGAAPPAALAELTGRDLEGVERALGALGASGLIRRGPAGAAELPSVLRAALPAATAELRARHARWVLRARPLPLAEAERASACLAGVDRARLLARILDRASLLDRRARAACLADLERLRTHGEPLPSELRSTLTARHADLVRYHGDAIRAEALAEEALELATTPGGRAEALLQLGLARAGAGAERALAVFDRIDDGALDEPRRAQLWFHRAQQLRLDLRSDEARGVLERLAELGAGGLSSRARLSLASLAVPTDPVRADRELARIEDDALLDGDEPRLLFARAWRGLARWRMGDLEQAIRLSTAAVTAAERLGYGVPQVEIGGTLAGALAAAGRTGAARERLGSLTPLATGRLRGPYGLWGTLVEALDGRAEAAAERASAVQAAVGPTPDRVGAVTVALARAVVRFAGDRSDPQVGRDLDALRAPGDGGRGAPWTELVTVAVIGGALLAAR